MARIWLSVVCVLGMASIGYAGPMLWQAEDGGNGHGYQFISEPLSWQDACDAAEEATFMGDSGHLVTITSQAERDFIYDNVTRTFANAGGSDAVAEGVWRWVVGPEAGEVFWREETGTITYDDWWTKSPSDGGPGKTEDYLMIGYYGYWNPRPGPGWNDYTGNAGYGYVVEFSNITHTPEPSSFAMFGVAMGCLLWSRRRTNERTVCRG